VHYMVDKVQPGAKWGGGVGGWLARMSSAGCGAEVGGALPRWSSAQAARAEHAALWTAGCAAWMRCPCSCWLLQLPHGCPCWEPLDSQLAPCTLRASCARPPQATSSHRTLSSSTCLHRGRAA
jgi:hypothetical protein